MMLRLLSFGLDFHCSLLDSHLALGSSLLNIFSGSCSYSFGRHSPLCYLSCCRFRCARLQEFLGGDFGTLNNPQATFVDLPLAQFLRRASGAALRSRVTQ